MVACDVAHMITLGSFGLVKVTSSTTRNQRTELLGAFRVPLMVSSDYSKSGAEKPAPNNRAGSFEGLKVELVEAAWLNEPLPVCSPLQEMPSPSEIKHGGSNLCFYLDIPPLT